MNKQCIDCDNTKDWTGVEYSYTCKEHYDGVSEWKCNKCGTRYGRWSDKILKEGQLEPVWGGK